MGTNHKKHSQQGFTIIEVLIVLAIAGLIMLVVFMAVPALQRNSRNNARKADARYMGVQRLQYNIDNETTATLLPPGGYDCSGDLTNKLYCKYIDKAIKHYDMQNVQFWSNTNVQPAVATVITDPEVIRTESHLRCKNGHEAEPSPTPRDMVVLFMIETEGTYKQVCVQNGLAPKS